MTQTERAKKIEDEFPEFKKEEIDSLLKMVFESPVLDQSTSFETEEERENK